MILGYKCTWIISENKDKPQKTTSTNSPQHKINLNPDHINLHKILILLICIGRYDLDSLHDLSGPTTDQSRLSSLFTDYYDYKVISNPNPRVTESDFESLLLSAKNEFKRKDINYQGIFIFYCGHGDTNNLILSDYDGQTDGIYDRAKFISFFNGLNIRRKAADYKLYFIDSCRGSQRAQVIPWKPSTDSGVSHYGDDFIHPETNRGILYGNPDNYQSYSIPYDEEKDDIAWDRLSKDNYMNNAARKHCGIFTNSIYKVFKDNATKYGFSKNYLQIQDMIKDYAEGGVPMKHDYAVKVSQKIENSDTLKGETKLKMYFVNPSYVTIANSQDIIGDGDDEKEVTDNDQDDNKYDNDDENEEQVVSKSDPEGLLKAWNLESYAETLVDEEGWDDPEDWKDIELDYLVEIGFKKGHARKFIRKAKELYQ